MLKILTVGENWFGSSARTLREGLLRLGTTQIDEFASESLLPKPHWLLNRACLRLLGYSLRREFKARLVSHIQVTRPNVLLVCKEPAVDQECVEFAKGQGIYTVNVFPDLSPFAHGQTLAKALGSYDIVISTKSSHPELWQSGFGYRNECLHVPHGYDPAIDYRAEPAPASDYDIALVATWREEYGELMLSLDRRLADLDARIVVAGFGWQQRKGHLPKQWTVLPAVSGHGYVHLLRSARIVIAPMTMKPTLLHGTAVPPEQDTTRSYQLAAAQCYFLHRRTKLMQRLYDERQEVPMWDSVDELADLVRRFLPDEAARYRMAASAHARAVPAYSIDASAQQILAILNRKVAHGD